jgi:hydrogenase nickel incorporation protein HypA/HybF
MGWNRRFAVHELAVTRSILETVLAHAQAVGAERVLRIHLRVGVLNEFQREWIQRYFDYLSRDTPAQGAALVVEEVPAAFRCAGCAFRFEADLGDIDRVRCPRCCGEELSLENGREFLIQAMEVE